MIDINGRVVGYVPQSYNTDPTWPSHPATAITQIFRFQIAMQRSTRLAPSTRRRRMSQNFPNVAALKSYITQSNSLLVKDLLNDAFLTVIGALESVNMTLLHEINKRS